MKRDRQTDRQRVLQIDKERKKWIENKKKKKNKRGIREKY